MKMVCSECLAPGRTTEAVRVGRASIEDPSAMHNSADCRPPLRMKLVQEGGQCAFVADIDTCQMDARPLVLEPFDAFQFAAKR